MSYDIRIVNHGFFKLDGGSMFGAVPKAIWEKVYPADSRNRIQLATNSLLLRGEGRVILVDVGNGDKWSDKQKDIFEFNPVPEEELGFKKEEVTDIILTHLHFDHAGGISYFNSRGNLALSYPNANVYLQEANFKTALSPNVREKASYLKENVEILKEANLFLLQGDEEIFPGVKVYRVDGHTEGQQVVEVNTGGIILLYLTDLCPTSRHLPLPYHMGYDMCVKTLLKEKKRFLDYAVQNSAVLVFEHDPDTTLATITLNEKKHYCPKTSFKSLEEVFSK
ncbi:MAG: MBL fold metallo-hydrolase [Candidatus Dadabacteria bacterium]|nr:MAG: MBL fold metallo-hydrolase [Candidatus Dadabacteria bacterium]